MRTGKRRLPPKETPVRTWYIIWVNCDCASYTTARTNWPKAAWGMRCDYCHRTVGSMGYGLTTKVRARFEIEAMEKYRQWQKDRAAKEATKPSP
jgi:hypothetical protein